MMKNTIRAGVLATVGAMALALSACGDALQGQAERAMASVNGDRQTEEKFALYTEAFNTVIGNFGPQDQFDAYVKLDIPTASANGELNFPESASRLQQVVDKLKQGRALKGGDAATRADAAADKLIAGGEALLTQWAELTPYFESQAYREDGLAKAKAAHPQLLVAYEDTLAAIEELDVALTEHLRARDKAQAEAYKASGNMAAYHVLNTMQQADYFATAAMEDDLAEADKLLPQLTGSLKELETTASTLPQDHVNKINMTSMVSRLNAMIGAYRSFKASKSDNDKQSLVHAYNGAVDASNNLQFEN